MSVVQAAHKEGVLVGRPDRKKTEETSGLTGVVMLLPTKVGGPGIDRAIRVG